MLSRLTIAHFVSLACTFLAIECADAAAESSEWLEGERIYQSNCLACHGPGGRPDAESPLVKSLGVVPANFSDALFNSREPEGDWKTVITHGGGALGFSQQMPAFGESLSEQEITAVLTYIKTLGGTHDYPDGSLNLFLPIRTKKAFPEDEWVWKQRYTDLEGDNAWKNTLEYEFRVGQRGQGILELTHETQGSENEFGHFEPGFKYVLKHNTETGFIASAAAQIGVPLNSDESWELLPYIAIGKILNDSFTFQGHTRLKLDLEDSDEGSAELAGVVHWVHSEWPRTVFPALEVVAEIPFDRGEGDAREDAVQYSLVPQARVGLNKRGNIALNLGLELPLNETERYDWRAYVYFIWDFADGGLLEGW